MVDVFIGLPRSPLFVNFRTGRVFWELVEPKLPLGSSDNGRNSRYLLYLYAFITLGSTCGRKSTRRIFLGQEESRPGTYRLFTADDVLIMIKHQ
jgi:hypothetical protein